MENCIYVGVSIYNELKNCKIYIQQKYLTQHDRIILSLYLGVINSRNEISEQLKTYNYFLNIIVNYKDIDYDIYNYLYNQYFAYIFENNEFNSINDYFIYLLNQDIIKEINKGKHIEDKFFDKNKVNKKIKLWGEKCQ